MGHFGSFLAILGHFWPFLGHFVAFLEKFAESSIFFAGFKIPLSSLLECMIESNNLTILTSGAGEIITSVCICEENYPGLDGRFTLFAIVCCVS